MNREDLWMSFFERPAIFLRGEMVSSSSLCVLRFFPLLIT